MLYVGALILVDHPTMKMFIYPTLVLRPAISTTELLMSEVHALN
jgi:hypothetical protein